MNKLNKEMLPWIAAGAVGVVVAIVAIYFTFFVDNTKLIKDTSSLEAGTAFNFVVTDYFETDDTNLDNWTVDTSKLDVSKLGNYEVTVKHGNKSYKLNIEVVDTKAPMVSMLTTHVFTNNVKEINTDAIEYQDSTACTVSISNFTKLDGLKVLEDKDIKVLTDALPLVDPSTFVLEETEVTEEGIYEAVVSVTDEAGNKACKSIIVVYDTTAPTAEFLDTTVKVESLDAEITPSAKHIKFYDNVDGEISSDKAIIEIEKVEDDKYLAHLSISDRAGNDLVGNFYITLEIGTPDKEDESDKNDKDEPSKPSKPDKPDNPKPDNPQPEDPVEPSEPDNPDPDGPYVPKEDEIVTYGKWRFNRAEMGNMEEDIKRLAQAGPDVIVDYVTVQGCGIVLSSYDNTTRDAAIAKLTAHINALGYEPADFTYCALYACLDDGVYLLTCEKYSIPYQRPDDL